MEIGAIRDWRRDIEIRPRARTAFQSLGPLEYRTEDLCTYAVDSGWLKRAVSNRAVSVLFVCPELAGDAGTECSLVLTDSPESDFYRFHNWLADRTDFYGSPSETSLDPTASVHESAHVDPTGVRIGPRGVVGPNASILSGTTLDEGVVAQAGCVLGADGLEFRDVDGERLHARHAGGVRVGAGSVIGAGTVVVRNVFNGATRIGSGVAVGNLVNVGHQTVIEDGALVMPGAVLCGSCRIGRNARIGPGAVVSNGVRVGDGAVLSMGSVAVRDVPPGRRVSGHFAIEHAAFLRSQARRS
jgi:UDP-3-O-[3-hydroxymyristoyl] glucosamine N-acyltransferase